jgi:hypothetical protein
MLIFVIGDCISLLLMYSLSGATYVLPVAVSVWISTVIIPWKQKPEIIEIKKLNEYLEQKHPLGDGCFVLWVPCLLEWD